MSHKTEKITVFNDDFEMEEDVTLYYSTVGDNVGITCGEQEVFLTQGQFKALAYLMRRCFYTRDMLDEMRIAETCREFPYTVYSSDDGKTWKMEIEKDRRI